MKFSKSLALGTAALAAIFVATYGFSQVRNGYWDKDTPRLTSQDKSISCSRATYRDYRKISQTVGNLRMDFSPIPQSITDKQRVIDGLASAKPAGNATQIFASYIQTGEVFRTQCASETCTIEEMWEPMTACQAIYWDDCVPSLIRYQGRNYCLLEVTESHE